MRQALYRKYRPREFNDVAGQIVPVKILKNAIQKDMVSHAYLFSGPRGTGKTSIAKIFAKNVNCRNNNEGMACNTCDFCQVIEQGNCVDIVEIDAASNNGVDEIRELKNKINLVPSSVKYKIYIIDEVHMLSIGAFNALLKTLEEPPSHVIFILATTDLHKVPSTIISRCQCLEFKKISSVDMVNRLKYVCQQENIEIEDPVLEKIAEYTDGGLRDSIGLLDKLASYGNNKVTVADFYDVIGSVSDHTILEFLYSIRDNDINKSFEYINDLYKTGKDVVNYLEQIVTILIKNVKERYSSDQNELIFSEEKLISILHLLYKSINDIKTYGNDYLILNMTVLNIFELLRVEVKKTILSGNISKKEIEQTDLLEKKVVEKQYEPIQKESQEAEVNPAIVNEKSPQESLSLPNEEKEEINWSAIDIKIRNIFIDASKKYLEQCKEVWQKLKDYTFDLEIGYYICLLLDGEVSLCNGDSIVLVYEYPSAVKKSYDCLNKLRDIIDKILEQKYNLVFIDQSNWTRLKNQYIQDRKNNIVYTYEEEIEIVKLAQPTMNKEDQEKIEIEDTTLYNEAVTLFGKEVVEISEER